MVIDWIFENCYKNYETREIREIVDSGIASGEISGWQKFRNARKFAKYGRQYGWERIPPF